MASKGETESVIGMKLSGPLISLLARMRAGFFELNVFWNRGHIQQEALNSVTNDFSAMQLKPVSLTCSMYWSTPLLQPRRV